ncbi:hypothetical protein SAMN05444920_11937 [Nonomuraea solani]|uniref:L-iditol 2-dehydrogenase n=2 Tax=Nonomuraea solani TaxID=1144553 RepID=A0A1H6ETB3_9ACTN|nr:hypothetical protein SAMN05444920_11937 [Nonomuraea solani]
MAGRRPEQRELAEALDVDDFMMDDPRPMAYDVVIEAAGSTAAVPVDDIVNNDLTIRGSFSYTASAWAETVRLLNAGRFRPLPLVTHRYGMEEHADALATLSQGAARPRGKILFEL